MLQVGICTLLKTVAMKLKVLYLIIVDIQLMLCSKFGILEINMTDYWTVTKDFSLRLEIKISAAKESV